MRVLDDGRDLFTVEVHFPTVDTFPYQSLKDAVIARGLQADVEVRFVEIWNDHHKVIEAYVHAFTLNNNTSAVLRFADFLVALATSPTHRNLDYQNSLYREELIDRRTAEKAPQVAHATQIGVRVSRCSCGNFRWW